MQNLLQHIKSRFNNHLERWLIKRIPNALQHKLTSKNIFIMPTQFGFAFLLFILLLFLMATNYQNNIILLFSYLMASLFLTAMMYSFFNLAGLIVKAEPVVRGHAQTSLGFMVTLTSQHRRFDLNFNFDSQPVKQLPVCEPGNTLCKVLFDCADRGRYSPGRMRVSSEYCFGLFITWTRLDFDCQAIVYPKVQKPKRVLPILSVDNNMGKNLRNHLDGFDDFYQLKDYVFTEPVSRIAWKQFAKGQGKLSKHYEQEQGDLSWLRLSDMPSNSLEGKLQLLCYLIIKHSKVADQFGVDLGSIKIPVNSGNPHMHQCLTALADFSFRR